MRYLLIVLVFLFWNISFCFCQNNSIDDVAGQWLEMLAEDGVEVDAVPEIEMLMQYLQNPFNINTARKSDLEQFFFLTEKQIENLLFYLNENGSLLTLFELQAVEGFDERTIRLLKPFVFAGSVDKQDTRLIGEALLSTQWLLEKPVGYRSNDHQYSVYQGDRLKLKGKGRAEMGSFAAGIAFEKDAGEPILSHPISTIDHLVGFVGYKSKQTIQQLVIGNYRLMMGQGLALSTGTSVGSSADPVNIRRKGRQLSGYASADEYRYLQGVASQIAVGSHVVFTPFISYKQIDGSIANDSMSLTGISTTGYHRTLTELNRRHNTDEWLIGLCTRMSQRRWLIEGGTYHYQLNRNVLPSDQLYQKYQFAGDQLRNCWIAYQIILGKAMLFGETVSSDSFNWAHSHGATWDVDNRFGLSVRFQQFDKSYYTPYGNAGSRFANPSGETNCAFGIRAMPSRQLLIDGWHLLYQSNWLRYQTDAPSQGSYSSLRASLQITPRFRTLVQFKNRSDQKNDTQLQTIGFPVSTTNQQNYRLQCDFQVSDSWRLTTRIDYCRYHQQVVSDGFLMYQDITWRHPQNKGVVTLRYCQFDTDDYDSRIYAYEPEVIYGFSIPAFSGIGNRIVLNSRFALHSNWDLCFRFARLTDAVNPTVGSGYDEVTGSSKNEVKVLVRYTFSNWIETKKDGH